MADTISNRDIYIFSIFRYIEAALLCAGARLTSLSLGLRVVHMLTCSLAVVADPY